jgi:hypothetical protein
MSVKRTLTAVELANQLCWDAKKLRGWLRSAAAAGHPLLRAHGHNDSWVFTSEEADQLRGEARRGPWQRKHNSGGLPATAMLSPAPMSKSENTASSAAHVADELRSGRATSADRLRSAQVPPLPGLYAWWHAPGLLPGMTHGRLVGDHLGSSTGKSTLRRALGAWLGAEQGWATQWRSSRVQHDAMSEQAVTKWMEQHLHVTWVRHESPHDVEASVIVLLAPPLNHQLNQGHPNWSALDAARRTWRERGTPVAE